MRRRWPALATVKALPGALPPLSVPDLSLDTIRALFGATLVMTLLALTEAVAIARAVALKYGDSSTATRSSSARVWPISPARSSRPTRPAARSTARASTSRAAHTRRCRAICAALFLILILFFVAPLARFLPYAAIAALLFLVAWGLIDRREIARIWREEPRDAGRWRDLHRDDHAVPRVGDPAGNHRGAAGTTVLRQERAGIVSRLRTWRLVCARGVSSVHVASRLRTPLVIPSGARNLAPSNVRDPLYVCLLEGVH